MTIQCEEARTLVPSYLDGELGEAQASPLRGHLMDCPACREAAKEGRTLQRWVAAGRPEPVSVPAGFAARVARRALAGDAGWLTPAEPEAPFGRRSLVPFLLVACSVAAAVLLVLALAIQRQNLPSSNGLEAREQRPPWLQPGESQQPQEQRPAPSEPDPEAPVTPAPKR